MKKKPYLLCAVVAAAVLTGCAGPAPVEVIASCEESTACVAETISEISTQTAEAAAKIIETEPSMATAPTESTQPTESTHPTDTAQPTSFAAVDETEPEEAEHVHNWEDSVVIPTCVEDGYVTHTSRTCGQTYTYLQYLRT